MATGATAKAQSATTLTRLLAPTLEGTVCRTTSLPHANATMMHVAGGDQETDVGDVRRSVVD